MYEDKYLIHQRLMCGEPPPECGSVAELLTICHECQDYVEEEVLVLMALSPLTSHILGDSVAAGPA